MSKHYTNADAETQAMIRFDKDGKIFLYADNIFVSKDQEDESEPTAKGETLRKTLSDFIDAINAHKHLTPSGISDVPINKADFKLIQDDLETIKHIGGVQSVQMTEEEIAAADSASLSGGSISSSTLSALGGNTKPDPDASKKLQKQIDSYDDKSIVVKSGNKKPTDALSDYLTKAGTQGEQINSKLLKKNTPIIIIIIQK